MLNWRIRIVDNGLHHISLKFTVEGMLKCTDFISNDANGPDISLLYIWRLKLIVKKFRGHKFNSTFLTIWTCFNPLLVLDIFCYSKTFEIQVSLPVCLSFYQEISRFYISVEDILRVEVEDYQDDVGQKMKNL